MNLREITDIKELRELQMQILDKIDEYCRENDLTYYLSSGTLLGAVRHGGYIPWDDDIDIYMPRASFDRFVNDYDDYNSRYKLVCWQNTSNYNYTFPKVVDSETILIEAEHPDIQIGIYVDVFPLDYVSDDLVQRKQDFEERDRLRHLLIARQSSVFRTLNPVGICYRLYARLAVSRTGLMRRFDSLMTKYHSTSQVCNMSDAGPSIKGCFDAMHISSDVDIQFENRIYKTMIGYKQYLQHTYGDYMSLPPENKRVHHEFKAYIKEWKRP